MNTEDLKKERTYTKQRFTRIKKSILKAVDEESSQRTIDARWNEFVGVWRELQEKHEAYLMSSEETTDDDWIEKVLLEFEETQSTTNIYYDTLCAKGVKEEKEPLGKKSAACKGVEILRRQESIRFIGFCEQLRTLLATDAENAKYALEAVKEFTSRLGDSKKKLDDLFIKFIEASISEGKDIPTTVDEEVKSAEKDFNKVYGDAKIFTSKFAVTKETVKEKRSTESGRLRLEKVKFDSFNGDIRKYPCFRKEFLAHVKPHFAAEEEAFVLKSYLDPEVREEVATLGEDAEEIWGRLDRKYGDEGKLVDSIMSDVKNIPSCSDEDPRNTLSMITVIERAQRDLKYMSMEQEISNSTIVSFIEQRLPKSIEDEWLKIVTGENRLVVGRDKFPSLFDLLLKHKERIEYKFSEIRILDSEHVNMLDGGKGKKAWCWLHPKQNEHPIWRCKDFVNKGKAEKINIVRANKACFACLEQGHDREQCPRGFKCRASECGKPHHTLIHVKDEAAFSLHGMGTLDSAHKEKKTLLLLQEINIKGGGQKGKREVVNCLWDNGSTLSFITFAMAKKLNLKGSKVNLRVTKIGGVTEEILSSRYNVSLINENNEVIPVVLLGLERISTKIQTSSVDDLVELFGEVSRTDIHRPANGEVDILLGLDFFELHPVRKANVNHLLLLKGHFGWIIGGSHRLIKEGTQKIVQHAQTYVSITEFEELEEIGVDCTPKCGGCRCGKCHPGGLNMTLEEEKEYRMVLDGLKYNEEGEYWTAHYPWKKDPNNLPNNYVAVLGVLISLEKRLLRNIHDAGLYREQLKDMLERHACHLVSQEELDAYEGPQYYIAHHAVFKPDSKSTPLRIVFDLSASFKGHVLNDYYCKGPSMLCDLLGLYLRFREEEFGFAGDISKMYHGIRISKLDQMTHLFLWRDLKVDQKPLTYAMDVVNFGDRPAGCIAIAVLNQTAEMSEEEYPAACKVIQNNSYVDDVLHSVPQRKEGKQLMSDITKVLKKGGFKIKNWVMSGGDSAESVNLTADDAGERVLGMLWDPPSDQLYFKVKLNFSRKKKKINVLPNLTRDNACSNIPMELTKRMILSQVNGIHNPDGCLGPYTVRAKMMIRKLWIHEKKLEWDDPIPKELRDEWAKFFIELFEVDDLRFERCMKPKDAVGDPMLVVFSDGSESAFGAVAYARWETKNGHFESRFIVCKNKIAPIKVENIVRLELCGAVLSKRIRMFIEAEMVYKFSQIVHLVDSEIVKAMIDKKSYGFRTFVANRVGEIQGSTRSEEWYWIPGELNIADWVTRGKHPSELNEGGAWRNGPDFLKLPFGEWPVQSNITVEELPERLNTIHIADAEELETLAGRTDLSRFSSLQLLLNTTARILKLYRRYKKDDPTSKNDTGLTSGDLKMAEEFWIKEAQKCLMEPMRTHKLIRLAPRMKGKVIVVSGRTSKWVAPTWNNEEFILLPAAHKFSLLVVRYMHEKGGHRGTSDTTAMVRSKYWIVDLPRIAKAVCHRCVTCRIKNKVLAGQQMAELPIDRLQPSPPFFVTGVDFFGPYCVRGEVNKRSRGKCYGIIFVCYSSRAVHVDLSVDYSTDAFLQTLRRFVSMRGWPQKFRSDNGSQLVAASKELRDVVSGLDHKRVRQSALVGGSDWEFTAADAPWMNGATEALVKSVKRALHMILRDQILTFSELQTVMYEAAELVNERPIGRNPTQPDDGRYLCPNDLLLGRASTRVPQGPFRERCSDKYRLDFLEKLVQDFWNRWVRDLFPNLVIRQKWHVDKRNVEKTDVVLVQDNNVLRGQYKMGVVTDVFPSDDGKVRTVEVSYKNNKEGRSYKGTKYTSVTRPVHKLVVIIPAGDQGSAS